MFSDCTLDVTCLISYDSSSSVLSSLARRPPRDQPSQLVFSPRPARLLYITMGIFSKLKTSAQNKVNDLQASNSAPALQQQQPLASSSSSNPSSPFIVARNGSLFLGNTPYRFAG